MFKMAANPMDPLKRITTNLTFAIDGNDLESYLHNIIKARDDPEQKTKLIGEKADGSRLRMLRSHCRHDLGAQQLNVLNPALESIVEGIHALYGGSIASLTTQIAYQVRRKNGELIEHDLPNMKHWLHDLLNRDYTFTHAALPLLIDPPFKEFDAVILKKLEAEKAGSFAPEILSRNLVFSFPKGHPSKLSRIIVSQKAGEKLPFKTTSVLHELRLDPIVDIFRMRVIVDNDAFKNPAQAAARAYEIFYALFPFFTDDVGMPIAYGFAPPKKPLDQPFIDPSRLLLPINVRKTLHANFCPEEAKKILSRDIPLLGRDALYQHLKAGFLFRGKACGFPPNVLHCSVEDSYIPAIEIQVTTSTAHKYNESYAKTTKETYTLYDMAKTMIQQSWDQNVFDTYLMLSEANIFGTLYDGPLPEASEFSRVRHKAEVIWNVVVPKLRRFHDEKNPERLSRAIQRELHESKNLKYYLHS